MAKRMTAFRFSDAMLDALDELARRNQADNRTALIEFLLAEHLKTLLRGCIHKNELIRCKTPEAIFRLFVYYCKAERKEEGYKFVPGSMSWHGDKEPTKEEKKKWRENPANRVVIGPVGLP